MPGEIVDRTRTASQVKAVGRQVPRAIEDASAEAQLLATKLGDLLDRLEPALRPKSSTGIGPNSLGNGMVTTTSNTVPPPAPAPLADGIRNVTHEMRASTSLVCDLLDRLEL